MTRKHHEPPDLAPVDSPLLHPANEGHDEERQRDRLEKWASQEDDRGPDARALRERQERELAAGAPLEDVLPLEPPTPPPARGAPHNADENLREHHTRGGEPKKHPERPEESTPEPGRGPHHTHAMAGEPPDVRPVGRGAEYEPGRIPTAGRKNRNED